MGVFLCMFCDMQEFTAIVVVLLAVITLASEHLRVTEGHLHVHRGHTPY